MWRLAGGHPRSLEYLDALLAGGQARYTDVTDRLTAAVTARLGAQDLAVAGRADRAGRGAGRDRDPGRRRRPARRPADPPRRVPGAEGLLAGLAVYREPVDHSAVLFQTGQPDPAAEHIPDRGPSTPGRAILADDGIPRAGS